MKNLKKLFLSLFVTVTAVVSCGDPDLPFEIYDTMKTGGYARLMSQTGEFNYFDQAGSKVTLEVEYYDQTNYSAAMVVNDNLSISYEVEKSEQNYQLDSETAVEQK